MDQFSAFQAALTGHTDPERAAHDARKERSRRLPPAYLAQIRDLNR